jgi:lipid-A-disaccharide synthase-like uncharacterized protein
MEMEPFLIWIIVVIAGILCLIYVEDIRKKDRITAVRFGLYISGIGLICLGFYKLISHFL